LKTFVKEIFLYVKEERILKNWLQGLGM
jgi:hypothetical protein